MNNHVVSPIQNILASLSKRDTEELTALIRRAIYHNQFQINIQSLDKGGVEQFSGHGCSNCHWAVLSTMTSGEYPIDPENDDGEWREYTQAEVHLFITDDSAQYLAGNPIDILKRG